MQSKAKTVAEYLKSLPADRRAAIEAVRKVIRENLDDDCEEGMQYGMIGYYIPHRVFPAGYHCDPKQPLPYGGLASQKQSMSLYLMSLYMDPKNERWLKEAWAKTGKKLDMGKACIRFRKAEDLALDVIGAAVRRVGAKAYVGQYLKNLADGQAKKSSRGAEAKKPAKAAARGPAVAKKSPGRAGARSAR